ICNPFEFVVDDSISQMPKVKRKDGYYAVKTGRQKGIYESWEKCKAQVHKFKNSEYRKFYTFQQAQEYLDGKKTTIQQDPNIEKIWTDGSTYKNGTKYATSGIGVFFGDNDPRNLS
ncbi:24863_t:CDS:1, partial [Cetraspora pellucida]